MNSRVLYFLKSIGGCILSALSNDLFITFLTIFVFLLVSSWIPPTNEFTVFSLVTCIQRFIEFNNIKQKYDISRLIQVLSIFSYTYHSQIFNYTICHFILWFFFFCKLLLYQKTMVIDYWQIYSKISAQLLLLWLICQAEGYNCINSIHN